ncbi:MAG: hypothetical protein A3J76_01970 [Candidatus Moranbacteria bacterium RBG_13_45_13]|nr:MAG: hypothetical protein A3J76_01970 [Candidatus Moranbacteria bacterium RBG_13_45_13]
MRLKDKNIRKITRVGKTSLAVTLPVEMVRELGWREKQRVVVKKIKGGFVIRDYRSKKQKKLAP